MTLTEANRSTDRAVAQNYSPLPVSIVSGEGAWVTDADGHQYLDLLAGYSALNFGHRHPRLVAAAHRQLDQLTLTSRAFGNDRLGPLCADLADLAGKEAVLVMNTGAEAVESGIKIARRWAYDVKGVAHDEARIITFEGNFHGRTTTIVGFSTDDDARRGFGPFTPGFDSVPFGDLDAVRRAITPATAAVLVEPIQGEAGVVVPPAGFLAGLREVCDENRVLLVADEIQSGLGRTGSTFACDLEGVRPDLYLLGKALGGGVVPVSAVVGDWDVIGVLDPGSHGSTFGGNPLGAAVAHEAVRMLATGEWQGRAADLGSHLAERLDAMVGEGIDEVRCVGPWAGIDVSPDGPNGREVCERLLPRGILAKDTHGHTLRLAPPLVITHSELDAALDQIAIAVR